MDFIQAARDVLGNLEEVDLSALERAEEDASTKLRVSQVIPGLLGDYTIHAGSTNDSTIDPDRVLIDADGVLIRKDGGSIRLDYKHSTNSNTFVDIAARSAELQFKIPNPNPHLPHVYKIETCEPSRIHINPITSKFMTHAESNAVQDSIAARKITLENTLTESIFDELCNRVPDIHFRVVGSHFKLNRFGRVHRDQCRNGFPCDAFSDETIDSKGFSSGDFEFGDERLKLQVDRILRNIVLDDEGRARLRVSMTALSAIMNYHLMLRMLPEFEVRVTSDFHPQVEPGFSFHLKTSKMAIVTDSDNQMYLCLPGIENSIKPYAATLLSPLSSAASQPVVCSRKGFLFNSIDQDQLQADLSSATMEQAVEFVKLGDLPRAIVQLAVVAVRESKSKVAAHMLSISVMNPPEDLDKLLEEAEDNVEEDDFGHLALSGDRSHTLSSLVRIGDIAVKPRGKRDIGVEPSYPTVLKHREGYKISVKVEQTDDMRWRISAVLKTPLVVLERAVYKFTGINVLGCGFSITARNKSYEVCQSQVAHSLLQGYFGFEGFAWIMGALLSNKVEVDDRSDATGYLPTSHVHFERGGVMLSEPLGQSVRYLNCVTNKTFVLIDWGPQLGAVKLERGAGNILRGRETGRNVDDTVWKRCKLSTRYMVQ